MNTPMFRTLFSPVLGALLMIAGGSALTQEIDPRVSSDAVRAEAAMNDLGARLRAALMAKMQSEGPVAAVGFCREEAPEIAARVSSERGLRVGRTALPYRSPANAPAAWQSDVLARFAEEAKRRPAGSLSWASREGHAYRQARGIATEVPCLVCHGTGIADPVRAAIAAAYPDDRATGFSEGELRGMFWVEIDRGPETAESAR